MNSQILITIMVVIAFVLGVESQKCNNPSYIIPVSPLDSAFDTTLDSIRSPQSLIAYLANPTTDNFIDYTITLLPAAAPLWAMGVLTFVLFIACSIQLCCFDVCGNKSCGNQMTTSTYAIRPIKILMCLAFTFSVFVIIITIIAMIINSGMISAAKFTGCNSILISQQLYNGSPSASTPWAGTNLFAEYITNTTVNLLNTQNFLVSYFSPGSGTTNQYDQVVSVSSGSLYSNSQQFACTASTASLVCPFIDTTMCPSPLTAVFNQQFCNATFTGSALNLIRNEMTLNSSTWRDSIAQLSSLLGSLAISSASVNSTINQVKNFCQGLDTYEVSISAAGVGFDYSVYVTEIVLYVFYSLILLGALISIFTLSATYCCGKLNCKVSACVFWIFYVFMGMIIFIASGFLLASTFVSYDSCQAYGFYFKNSTNYNLIADSVNAANPSLNTIINSCFFDNDTSVFTSTASTLKTQLGQMETLYKNSNPANSFYSVVSTIEQQLLAYFANPNTIVFTNQNATNSANAALALANNFVNFSAPNSSQTCQKTRDLFVFNSVNCFPYSAFANPPNNSCVILFPGNPVITSRVALFTGTTPCTNQGNMYQQYATALNNYAASARTIADFNLVVPYTSTNSLHQYQTNYFNYYSTVKNFMSIPVQQAFNSFLTPYSQISSNSSCSFVTKSLNAIVDISCNQLFPYINAFTIVNIILAACIFILMSVFYFLMPRLQFYAVLQGNFDNWGEKTFKAEQLNATQMTNMSNMNQDFLTSTDRQNV